MTATPVPVEWRYDLTLQTTPYLIERLGVNAVFNAGGIELDGQILIVCRVEGYDRTSFFAVAESSNGRDHFRFWDAPIELPETAEPDINVYDTFSNGGMRRTDGTVFLDYASADPRLHVAASAIERLLDYVLNTPEDGRRSAASV